MAFCPQCGREQRCGCEECHSCGVRLVESLPATGIPRPGEKPAGGKTSAAAPASSAAPPSPVGSTAPQYTSRSGRTGTVDAADAPVRSLAGILPTLLVVLGVAVLMVTVIEMARLGNQFVTQGMGFSSGSLRRLGYYMGSVFYSGSVRILCGFALVILGMLIDPPRPLAGVESWQRGMVVTGALAGIASIGSLLSVVFMVLPGGGTVGLSVRDAIPSLAWSVPVLVVLGIALMWASYLVSLRAVELARGDTPVGKGPGKRRNGVTGRRPRSGYADEKVEGKALHR